MTERMLAVLGDRRRSPRIAELLKSPGRSVVIVDHGAAALAHLETAEPDLIVVDLSLPGMDGVDLCRQLRVWVRSQILVVADGAREQAIAALDAGADDFVTWPIDEPELAARLRVARRHARAMAAAVGGDVLVCGDVQIDIAAHMVMLDDRPVELQPRQFTLLATLARNAGRLVSYATLARVLWGDDHGEDDVRRLRSTVSVLRRRIGEGPRRPVIESAPTLGYRLVPPAS